MTITAVADLPMIIMMIADLSIIIATMSAVNDHNGDSRAINE